jgi:hypothetical protein
MRYRGSTMAHAAALSLWRGEFPQTEIGKRIKELVILISRRCAKGGYQILHFGKKEINRHNKDD